MDHSDVRRGGGGGAGDYPDAAVAESDPVADCIARVAHRAALAVYRTLRRISASRYAIASPFTRFACRFVMILGFGGLVSYFSFELMLDIYWKSEHRLKCKGDTCTAAERDRYERSVIYFAFCIESSDYAL